MSKTFNLKRDVGIELPDAKASSYALCGLDICPQCSGVGVEEITAKKCRKCAGLGLTKIMGTFAKMEKIAKSQDSQDAGDDVLPEDDVLPGDTVPSDEDKIEGELQVSYEDRMERVGAYPPPESMKQSIISMLRGSFEETVQAVFDYVASLPGMPPKPDKNTKDAKMDYIYMAVKRTDDQTTLRSIFDVIRKHE